MICTLTFCDQYHNDQWPLITNFHPLYKICSINHSWSWKFLLTRPNQKQHWYFCHQLHSLRSSPYSSVFAGSSPRLSHRWRVYRYPLGGFDQFFIFSPLLVNHSWDFNLAQTWSSFWLQLDLAQLIQPWHIKAWLTHHSTYH